MTIVHMIDRNRLVLALNGDLDLTTADALREALDDLLSHYPQKQVALDLGDVDFVDSSGLGVILGRYRRLKQAGRSLCLIGVRPSVLSVLEIAGIPSVMAVAGVPSKPWARDS